MITDLYFNVEMQVRNHLCKRRWVTNSVGDINGGALQITESPLQRGQRLLYQTYEYVFGSHGPSVRTPYGQLLLHFSNRYDTYMQAG